MNIIMCPADKFVAKRMVNVNGRIIWEKISTRGRRNINLVGVPKGTKWEKNKVKLVVKE